MGTHGEKRPFRGCKAQKMLRDFGTAEAAPTKQQIPYGNDERDAKEKHSTSHAGEVE
jgi:hypothetical protein